MSVRYKRDEFHDGKAHFEHPTSKRFDGAFEALKDEVTGAAVVESAADRMGTAVDEVSASLRQLKGAVDGAAGQPGTAQDEVVVTGRREKREPLTLQGLFGKALTGLAKGVGIGDEAAKKIGSSAGKGFAGALEGQTSAGVAGMLGIKSSGTGAGIGGAIGGLTGLPGGSIVGGLLGGVIGNLFRKPLKGGSATIDDTTTAATTSGNSRALEKAASGFASNVLDALSQIASQLGGSVGSFTPVTIGKYGESFKVNTTGASTLKKGKAGVVDFDEDQGAAPNFAIQTALARGAVQGLSANVAKALQSSTDVTKAVNEALKVQQVEETIGGIGAAVKRVFADADTSAAERVRVAKAYGLDLVSVEKANAEERAKLLADTLQSRVGALTSLRDELSMGSLFEGSAADKRDALWKEIAGVQAKAEAGEAGAADRLAQFLNQTLTNTREGYGAAGNEYSDDRARAQALIDRVVAIEDARVREAAGGAEGDDQGGD